MHVGRKKVKGGRCAEPASTFLTQSLEQFGITHERMKTGTPVRIDARSVHYEDMETQPGENDYHRFSYISELRPLPQLPCWTCNTNAEVHEVLRRGLPDSPLYNGQIQSIGPRYCPSIETKIVTFAERDQHPLFLEPEGIDTNELYLNGFSSSLPLNIQLEALKKIPCFRDVKVYRPGYAIEYDFFQPTQLRHSLESKKLDGLFFAGQVNGTTGYEEAAGQGIIAGINAALKCAGNEPFMLHRDEAISAFSSMTSSRKALTNLTVCLPPALNTASCCDRTMPTRDSRRTPSDWELPRRNAPHASTVNKVPSTTSSNYARPLP